MGIDDLLKPKRDDILRTAARYGASNVRVFGSVARGEAGPDSDVDLLMDFAPDQSLLDHASLWQDLEDLLGRDVDLVTEKGLYQSLRDRVLGEAVPL